MPGSPRSPVPHTSERVQPDSSNRTLISIYGKHSPSRKPPCDIAVHRGESVLAFSFWSPFTDSINVYKDRTLDFLLSDTSSLLFPRIFKCACRPTCALLLSVLWFLSLVLLPYHYLKYLMTRIPLPTPMASWFHRLEAYRPSKTHTCSGT